MADLIISGEIGFWGVSSREVRRELNNLNGDIEIELNSPGGSVFEGISIFNAIKDYNKGKVTIIIKGLAASMGSYIALAGDVVKAYDNAVYMIHNARTDVYSGDAPKLRKIADLVEGLSNLLKKAYTSKTGKSDKVIQNDMNNETFYFGKEILDYGFVDEIIDTVEEKNKQTAMAIAHESFNSCMKNIEANAKKEDIEEIAALLKNEENQEKITPKNEKNDFSCYNDEVKKPNKEKVSMNLSQLKSEHPDLYTEVFNSGVKSEKERVLAHVEMSKTSGAIEYALECIEKGEQFSSVVQAKYMGFAITNQQKQDRQEENVDDVQTDMSNTNVDENEQKDEIQAKALADRLGVDFKAVGE